MCMLYSHIETLCFNVLNTPSQEGDTYQEHMCTLVKTSLLMDDKNSNYTSNSNGSQDKKNSIQFLMIMPNHECNKESVKGEIREDFCKGCIKVWDHNSLGHVKCPEFCNRITAPKNFKQKVRFSENWKCKFSKVECKVKERVKSFESSLKQCSILEDQDAIVGAMEVTCLNCSRWS